MKLPASRWTVAGKPVLGTYGADRLEDLERVNAVGMNVVLAGDRHLDAATPEGAFCLTNGLKVMHHLTQFIYHGVRLREPVAATQRHLPLVPGHGGLNQTSRVVQIDNEWIRFERITDNELVNCERGFRGTKPAAHREGVILFWPEVCAAEVARVKDSPNLFGYYVLDDSPGDAVSALRAMYRTIQEADPGRRHPVCAGFGNTGSLANFAPGVCDILIVYQYPVSPRKYDRERTSEEVQHILTTARQRVPGVPFMGIYQAFDGRPANTGQGVPTPDQLREQLEDFVREGACGLIAYLCHHDQVPGWADVPALAPVVAEAHGEILTTGKLVVRAETDSMQRKRFQPTGDWRKPRALPGVVPAWWVLGPFVDTEGRGLTANFPPDSDVDLAAMYPVKFGRAGWRVRPTSNGTMGLTEIWGAQLKSGVAYAVCDVTSPRTQTVQLRFCSDDDAWVRLNGREVHRYEQPGGLDFDRDVVPVTLPSGRSRIEVKVHNRKGMWAFFLRFTDAEGRPLKGLRFSPAAP